MLLQSCEQRFVHSFIFKLVACLIQYVTSSLSLEGFFSSPAMKMSANPWRDEQVVTQTQYLDLELSS